MRFAMMIRFSFLSHDARFFTLRERERYWIPFSTKEEIIKKIREIPERMLKLVIAFRFHTTFYGKISSIASPAFISS